MTRYLLDTSIISNVTRPAPSQALVAWMAQQIDEDLFIANGHVYPQVDGHGIGTSFRQKNHLFRNDGKRFVEVGPSAGPGLAIERSFRGAAFAFALGLTGLLVAVDVLFPALGDFRLRGGRVGQIFGLILSRRIRCRHETSPRQNRTSETLCYACAPFHR